MSMMDRVAQAMSSGVIFVCATCNKYWKGQDLGLNTCTAEKCGSPRKGMMFPEYDGILTPDVFSRWCFICSVDSTHGVLLDGEQRMCGVCDKHLHGLHPANAPFDDVSFKIGAARIRAARFFGKQKRTLAEEIYEVEKYYADKEGRLLVPDQTDGKVKADSQADS